MRMMEKVPTAPVSNVAVNVAMSSLSTGSVSSLTAPAAVTDRGAQRAPDARW